MPQQPQSAAEQEKWIQTRVEFSPEAEFAVTQTKWADENSANMKITPHSIKSLENKAYKHKEVTLIQTLFTENWPRQGVQIHRHHSYITAHLLSGPSRFINLCSFFYRRNWELWGKWGSNRRRRSGSWEEVKSVTGRKHRRQRGVSTESLRRFVSFGGLLSDYIESAGCFLKTKLHKCKIV